MNEDGLSYLDLASDAATGGIVKLVNGFWSPGYPALISLGLSLLRPSPKYEVPVIHLINYILFLFALWGFTFFLRHWLPTIYRHHPENERKVNVTPLAFAAFLWFTLQFNGTESLHPDLGVTAIVFFLVGIICRISLSAGGWQHYVCLGAVLGLGYYMKAAMFPLGILCLGILALFSLASNHLSRPKLLLAAIVFLLVSSPLVAALSVREKRLTIGETGRLAYAWYVNGVQHFQGWTGDPANTYGRPEHPPRKLMEDPLILQFESRSGTFPAWYDPAYWNAGLKPRLDLRQQILGIKENLLLYKYYIAYPTLAFFVGAIVLCGLILYEGRWPAMPRHLHWLLAWPLSAFVMFGLVHVEARFFGGFLVVFWLTLYAALSLSIDQRSAAVVCVTVLSMVLIPWGFELAMLSGRIASDFAHPTLPAYEAGGLGLERLGLVRGDRLAVVGRGVDCYYARFARLRVVAYIPNRERFWQMSAAQLNEVANRLAAVGIKALVAPNRPPVSASANWKDVKASDTLSLSVLLLSPRTQ